MRLQLSMRARLILGNILVTFLAVSILGYYIFYRTQQSNAFLVGQLDQSINQQAVTQLNNISIVQTDELNNFFASLEKDVGSLDATTSELLTEEPLLATGEYWNASQSLNRLPNGSWSNSSNDAASVFIPAKIELTDPLIAEINTLKHLDFSAPNLLKKNPDVIAIYFGGPLGETVYYPNIDLANVVPADFDVTGRPWYLNASPENNPNRDVVWSDPYLDAARHGLVVTTSAPVFDASEHFRGVAAMDIQLSRITDVVSGIHVGQTGYAFLIDKGKRLIAFPPTGYQDFGFTPDQVPLGNSVDAGSIPQGLNPILDDMSTGKSGLATISLDNQQRFVAYRSIPSVGYSLAIIVPVQELLTGSETTKAQTMQFAQNTLATSTFIIAGILILSLLATLIMSSMLMQPVRTLTKTAEEIAAGNLNARANVHGEDEIGRLAATFNTMTARLRDTLQGLEQRVADRTAELRAVNQRVEGRAAQFEAITRVTRAISSIRNLSELLPLITSVINQHFNYYHIGIFMNDENDEYTVLIATNSEGGHRMIERGHQLKIGEQGIVGYVASKGEARLARNVGEDIVFFNNPDLPETKSEAALPLHSGDSIIGVLDVQSTQIDAFSQEDMNILAVLADQVGLAIENAHLFETTNRSLTEAETLYRQYLRDAWTRLPREEHISGFRYTPRGATPLQKPVTAELHLSDINKSQPDARLIIPINLRGETIGNLIVQAPPGRQWTQDQIDLIEAAAERVALAAENARLFEETSHRAERERLVSEITTKIRSTNNPDQMVKTALDELKEALSATQVQIISQVISDHATQDEPLLKQEFGAKSERGNGAKK